MITGSIGASDSTIEMEGTIESLAAFEEHLEKMNAWPKMQSFGDRLASLVVPGTGRFEVFRIV